MQKVVIAEAQTKTPRRRSATFRVRRDSDSFGETFRLYRGARPLRRGTITMPAGELPRLMHLLQLAAASLDFCRVGELSYQLGPSPVRRMRVDVFGGDPVRIAGHQRLWWMATATYLAIPREAVLGLIDGIESDVERIRGWS